MKTLAMAPDLDLGTVRKYRSIYVRALFLSLVIVGIELTGSIVSGSFVLQADVWHVIGDVVIASTPVAVAYSTKSGAQMRYLLLFGGIVVSGTLGWIGYAIVAEAWQEALSPAAAHEVHGLLLSAFALLAAGVNLWQYVLLSRVHDAHRDIAHRGYHFHVAMDFLKNLALPTLGGLLALQLVPQRADSWAALAIGAWIVVRAAVLLVATVVSANAAKPG
jgi:Co/Zn/Cd efflux system component